MKGKLSSDEPIFTPQDFLRYVAAARGVDPKTFRIPSRLIMVYQKRHFAFIDRLIEGKPAEWWWYSDRLPLQVGRFGGVDIAVATNFVGSPAAAMVLEELISCGAEKIIEVGTSGGLQSFLKPGDIVVATEAICDEGTTCQYSVSKETLTPSRSLKGLLVKALRMKGLHYYSGAVLTTDGVYRETRGKLRRLREAGVLAIDMETSALYAVAIHRRVEIASVLIISDLLTDSEWRPAFGDPRVSSSAETVSRLAIEAISKA